MEGQRTDRTVDKKLKLWQGARRRGEQPGGQGEKPATHQRSRDVMSVRARALGTKARPGTTRNTPHTLERSRGPAAHPEPAGGTAARPANMEQSTLTVRQAETYVYILKSGTALGWHPNTNDTESLRVLPGEKVLQKEDYASKGCLLVMFYGRALP
ncbi:unnamed protein product [Pleuronectes platessa]|uniref:Uncharacterized protein n=1 Tax=Pleuronectes platessa TaxID=8262 RepID=A0A9N7UJQ9_PLEPL|nr:unnamed protein product [Pleuronectes platessa]